MESRNKVEHEMSLAALRRTDPYISGIVDVTGQVALYSFSAKTNEWEKTDIEGTLFVYTRSASPHHGFTIMNRLNMNNLVEPVNKDLEFQLHEPFLLYRNANLSIYSIWFYDKNDCQRIAKLMTQVVQQESEKIKNRKSPIHTNGCSTRPIDILEMLSKAKCEYEKGQGNDFISSCGMLKNCVPSKIECSETSEYISSIPQDKPFQTGQKHLTVEELFGTSVPKEQPATTYLNPEVNESLLPDLGEHNVFLQSHPIQPVVVKAESRSFNCSASDFSHPSCLAPALIPKVPVSQVDLQNVPKYPVRVSPSVGPSAEILSTSVPHSSNMLHVRQMSPTVSQAFADHGSAPQSQPSFPPLAPIRSSSFSNASHPNVDLLQKLKLTPQADPLHSQTISKTAIAPKFSCTPNQLATPESFKESSLKTLTSGSLVMPSLQNTSEKREPEAFTQPKSVSKVVATSQFVVPTTTEAAPILWSPRIFEQSASAKHSGQEDRASTPPLVHHVVDRTRSSTTGLTLNRIQLQETLVHLIKNDSSFLNMIHEAYLQALAKRMDNVKL